MVVEDLSILKSKTKNPKHRTMYVVKCKLLQTITISPLQKGFEKELKNFENGHSLKTFGKSDSPLTFKQKILNGKNNYEIKDYSLKGVFIEIPSDPQGKPIEGLNIIFLDKKDVRSIIPRNLDLLTA